MKYIHNPVGILFYIHFHKKGVFEKNARPSLVLWNL